ncbi:hypothetical protein [Maridesulfovibrio hydrothermalis]|uniref:Magnetosome protein MamS/MamX domain-containing protein n=1 Tax=Maridesulfovibrio hydrothermalis AM13 = DSM 14728 TaxID=1121451 RepID=L0RBE0_9BACT|nr:hypothetical protein [Maridesulfovibrio hydrothermalis]CCO23537.1 conserved exported protein of unknown function [Maridesulfovibrio hydrothermalis AM13 = DSM 14728]
MIKRFGLKMMTVVCLVTLAATAAFASDMDIRGWEKGSEYDRLYDNTDREVFKGTLLGIKEITPLDGMAKGIAVLVKDKEDGEKVLVHLGPKDFVKPRIKDLRSGVRVKVYGVLVEIDGEYEYMAAKLKAGEERKYKFRLTKDGTPFWSLSAADLKREEAGVE